MVYINIDSKTSNKIRKKKDLWTTEINNIFIFSFYALAKKNIWLIVDLGNDIISDWVNITIKKIDDDIKMLANVLFTLVTIDIIAIVIAINTIEVISKIW